MPRFSHLFRPTRFYALLPAPKPVAHFTPLFLFRRAERRAFGRLVEIPLPRPTLGHIRHGTKGFREVKAITAPKRRGKGPSPITTASGSALESRPRIDLFAVPPPQTPPPRRKRWLEHHYS